MRVLFLVPDLNRASCRYRVLQYLPWLEQAGISCETQTLRKGFARSVSAMRSVRRADVVLVQKKLLAPLDILTLRTFASRLIYDFDDAVMFRSSKEGNPYSFGRRLRFALTMRWADLVIAGNEYLRERALYHRQNVRVLPTPLDMDRYIAKPAGPTGSPEVILGWIGSRRTLPYLYDIAGALEQVAVSCPSVKLKIVADRFFTLKRMPVIEKPWSYDEEIADLQSFDIGLMPLTDDVWARGKCGFKLLQYMAVGVPAVCSPVGINREIVEPGVQGAWAVTQKEWVDSIESLVRDANLRTRQGRAAREKVIRHYSLARMAPLFIDCLLDRKASDAEAAGGDV